LGFDNMRSNNNIPINVSDSSFTKGEFGLKVLLVTYFFPPLNTVASLRTYSFAYYLAKEGFEVTVLTVTKGSGQDVSLTLSHDSFQVEECDYRSHHFNNDTSPVRHSARKTLLHLMRHLKLWWLGNLITPWDLWFKTGLSTARQLMIDNRYDCIISSHAPISCHLIALFLKKKFPTLFWVADYRDLWSNQHFGTVAKFPFSILQKAIERRINKNADILVTVSPTWRDTLIALYGKECLLLENGYLPGDEPINGINDRPVFSKKYTFVYTGVFYEGKYDPIPFFEALQELVDCGMLEEGQAEVLIYGPNSNLLQESLCANRFPGVLVKLMSQVSRDEALRIQRGATALIFLAQDKPEAQGVLTGKIYEYMVAGRPIIACGVSPESAVGQLLTQTTSGFICGSDKKKIVEALRDIVDGKIPTPNMEKIKQYRRDRLVSKLAELLKNKLA